MLKIKEDKWKDFQKQASKFGFKLNEYKTSYCNTTDQDVAHPRDYFQIQINTEDRTIQTETSNSRYGGFYTDGKEFSIIYDLITAGYIEKVS